ncbi:hypothetical protein GY45DRAFT_1320485 [Cubamyces sp. BRFM 1775]|nr:hypothetical protein GY45DRAFT_1320485 [Cubamyces sp. BRFM 1775]
MAVISHLVALFPPPSSACVFSPTRLAALLSLTLALLLVLLSSYPLLDNPVLVHACTDFYPVLCPALYYAACTQLFCAITQHTPNTFLVDQRRSYTSAGCRLNDFQDVRVYNRFINA